MSVNQKILDAIELLTNHSIEKAGYDKTIQAQVISCEDATIGKYKCRYQDMTFIAYAGTADVTYSKGAYVYILIPGNDMSRDKTILGTTQKLGINYISEAVGEQAYDILGQNCVTTSGTYYLATKYKQYSYTIYKYNITSPLKIDSVALNQYIKKSSSLIVGMTIQNNILPQEQYQGHYGITFNLVFKDNSNLEENGKSKQIIKSYTLDEDNMTGNPYRFQHNTRQYEIFNIDGENFDRIESINIFCQNFPNSLNQTPQHFPLTVNDSEVNIIFSSVEILGAIRKTEEENNGISISFYTPKGTFFKQNSKPSPTESLPITAQVRIKGKIVSDAQKLSFYWGRENVGIFANSQYYNQFLGRGWQCLNEKNIISQGTETQNPQIEWIPASNTYIITRSMATAKENKIKVAVLYDGTVISKEITIQNLQTSIATITIESDGGTQFYYDVGHPTLTCKINGVENTENYIYSWAWQNNSGSLTILEPTTIDNNLYNETYELLQALKTDITNGDRFKNEAQQDKTTYENMLADFKYIQRVEKNKIYDLQINKIDGFAIFKCTVYDLDDNYIGTASITLSNSLQAENIYTLVIENGSVSYKYNQNGIAPNSKSLIDPQEILALTFKVYDNLGNDITTDIKKKQVTWKFPLQNTLLNDINNHTQGVEKHGYRYYSNKDTLLYDIAQKYNIKSQNNQIELFVTYKEINLVAKTNFNFVKEGQPGTNGTQYIVKIIPYNVSKAPTPVYPMFTIIGGQQNKYFINYVRDGINATIPEQELNFNNSQLLFQAQLWQGGQRIWKGQASTNASMDGQLTSKPTGVSWSVLKNKYNTQYSDTSDFTFFNTYNLQYNPGSNDFSNSLANILKCSITYNNNSYYGTIPVTTAWIYNRNYRIQLKDYTGFRYVTYSSDGMSPQYDNSKPFEFIVKQKINDIWEDVSLVEGPYAVTFNFLVSGDTQGLPSEAPFVWTKFESKNLEILTSNNYTQNLQKNQCVCRPSSRYNGECVNNALICTATQVINNQTVEIARIHVPIHFLLNKYGLAHINAWDGNSIQVDNEGGYILAPQMGAGKKENDNSFTGVLMGEVKNPDKNKSDIGLLGYNKGDRTFFLNSENGSALFGKAGAGQIIIDPRGSTQKAFIYSGNYWNQQSFGEDGLPKDSATPSGNGMLIDLTTPKIEWGNGNFSVNSNGQITAKGAGKIAGWTISDHSLSSHGNASNQGIKIIAPYTTTDENNNVIQHEPRIYSNTKSYLNSAVDGFFISEDGISIGSKFKVTKTGVLTLGQGAVSGGSRHWTINANNTNSYISFGGDNDGNNPNNAVYIGTDKITLGSNFSVTNTGSLTAKDGKIGGWTINSTSLTGGNVTLNNTGALSGPDWFITSDGNAYFGKIYGEVMTNQTFSGGGFSITGGGGTNFTQGLTSVGNQNIKPYVEDVAYNKITANIATINRAYVTSADIDNLLADYITADSVSANYVKTSDLIYDGYQASWGFVVTNIFRDGNIVYVGYGVALGRWYVDDDPQSPYVYTAFSI